VWEWHKCCWKMPNQPWTKQEFKQKIVTKATNSETRVVGLLVYFHTNWKHWWKQVFANNFIFPNDTCMNIQTLVTNWCLTITFFQTPPHSPFKILLNYFFDFSLSCRTGFRFQFQTQFWAWFQKSIPIPIYILFIIFNNYN
jgi:hypothetical protein